MKILSGIQPSGQLHIGNYFGMMQTMISHMESDELYVFIVDLHALTSVHDSAKLATGTLEAADRTEIGFGTNGGGTLNIESVNASEPFVRYGYADSTLSLEAALGSTPAERDGRLAQLQRFLAGQPRDGGLLVLVTHQVTISAVSDTFADAGTGVLMALGKAGATNAALLAAQILALKRPDLRVRLARHRRGLRRKVDEGNRRLREEREKRT